VPCVLIDTGGLIEHASGLEAQMRVQTEKAVAEGRSNHPDGTDARSGLTTQDQFIARELLRTGKPVVLALNKAEGLDPI
jgi:GTP-binding protein